MNRARRANPLILGLSSLVPLVGGCRDGDDAAPDAPTWNNEVAHVMSQSCAACHQAGGVAPFALDTYDDAAPMAEAIARAVESGTMPPWGAKETDDCEPRYGFQNDLSLSEEDIAVLRAWADGGALEGGGEATVEAPPTVELDGWNQLLQAEPAYAPEGEDDQIVCFSIDPELATDVWLTGMEVVPDNTAVVHHVLVYADPAQQSGAMVGEDGVYPCFGGPKVDDTALLGGWAPGSVPWVSPEGAGIPVSAGTHIVMQVHYFPNGARDTVDQSWLRLRWTETEPERIAILALAGNASSEREGLLPGPNDDAGVEFRIPANVPDHAETIEYVIDDGPLQIFSIGTHMHLVGSGMRIEVDHAREVEGEPLSECLLETPAWDFDWQRVYDYDAEIDDLPVIRRGDTLRLRCTYDNTLDNPGVVEALSLADESAPRDVYLGEGSLDEMCLGVFGVLY